MNTLSPASSKTISLDGLHQSTFMHYLRHGSEILSKMQSAGEQNFQALTLRFDKLLQLNPTSPSLSDKELSFAVGAVLAVMSNDLAGEVMGEKDEDRVERSRTLKKCLQVLQGE